jgi:hypothetical protein
MHRATNKEGRMAGRKNLYRSQLASIPTISGIILATSLVMATCDVAGSNATIPGGLAAKLSDASRDQTVHVRALVELAAFPGDGHPIHYHWRQISGATVQLINPDHALASFRAPALSYDEKSELFEFELTATDPSGRVNREIARVTVIAPTESGACTLTINPGDSFITAFGLLGAGDTLCLNDGTYQQAMDIPSGIHVRAVNDGMAELDGMSSLGLEWQGGILTMSGSGSSVRGLRVHHAGTNADACTIAGSNNIMRSMSCSHGGVHKHKIPLKVSGSGHLIEDSWFFGEGRYVLQCFQGNHITIRRNVIRWDSTVAGEPNEPNASMSNYSCSDMIWENNISLDYGVPETPMIHCGDMCMSTTGNEDENYRVQYLGNIVINHDPTTSNNKAFRADQKGTVPSSDVSIEDFYVRSVGLGIAVNPLYQNFTVGKCTMIDVSNAGVIQGVPVVCDGDADISYQYVDGIKTTQALFPFVNEGLIKRDMCATGERQSDWCISGKSLSDYVLQADSPDLLFANGFEAVGG